VNKFFLSHKKHISVAYIWICGGSNLDKINKNGINQILCSLLTRGCKSFDNFEISNILDSNGAELYYETLEDGIFIGVKSLNEYFKNVYPILELLITESNLPEKEFLKCKNSQINYIIKSKENLFIKTFDNWKKLVYKKHPYSFDANGYLDSINNIKYEDILNEYNNFIKRNMFLLSNYKMENFIDINLQSTKNENGNKFNNEYSNFNKLERFVDSNTCSNQIIMMLGNQTCPHNSEDFLALKILESHLAYGMSSVLFKTFREKNGFTYDAGIIHPVRIENAPFLIYLSVSNQNALNAFKLLANVWEDFSTKLISIRELNLAKTKLKNSILHSNQFLEEIILRKVQLIGYQMDSDYDLNSIDRLNDINAETVNQSINKYLKKPFLSLLGDSLICNEIKKYWISKF